MNQEVLFYIHLECRVREYYLFVALRLTKFIGYNGIEEVGFDD
jgi:hypothetical protein